MIDEFNGITYLVIFIIHFAGYAFYSFRCIFSTKAFVDQYGMGDGAAIITRFFGGFFVGSVLMALNIMFIRSEGLEGSWAFFNLIFLQNLGVFLVSLYANRQGSLGTNEKTSIEGYIAE